MKNIDYLNKRYDINPLRGDGMLMVFASKYIVDSTTVYQLRLCISSTEAL